MKGICMASFSVFEVEQPTELPPLPPALMDIAARLQQCINATKANWITTAYGIGQSVATVLSQYGGYGPKAIVQLAEYAGISPAIFYGFCNLFRVFDREFINRCRERTTSKGNVITLLHLFELARVYSLRTRDELVEQFYEMDLSVGELRELIRTAFVVRRCA
jgi:hypothetical protein